MYRWYYKVLFIAVLVPFLVSAAAVTDGKVKKEKDDGATVQLFKGGKYSINANKVAGDTLFIDDFNSGMDTTNTWTIVDGFSDGLTWTDTNPGGRTDAIWDSTFIIVDSDNAGSVDMDEEFISPWIDCTLYSNITLAFDHYFRQFGSSIGDVDVRVGMNGTWTNVAQYTSSTTENASLDISSIAANTDSVQVRFHYYNANWDYYWGIDNVLVSGSNVDGTPPDVATLEFGWNHTEGFGDVTIVADIADPSGIASANVYYSINDINGTYTPVAMSLVPGKALYSAAIPAATAGDSVYYYVEAVDASSNGNVGRDPATGFVYGYIVYPNVGGPDTYGYMWYDSHSSDPMAPTYSWIDTAGATSTGIANGDDWRGTVDLPFPLNFYGNTYNQITVTTNGWIGLGPHSGYSSSYWVNDPIPSTSTPDNVIAPMWDDWKAGGSYGGDMLTKTIGNYPNRQFVVIFKDMNRSSSNTDFYTFEAIFNEGSNDIIFQYMDVTGGPGTFADYGAGASVGIENADATDGLQYTYNMDAAQVFDGLAIQFYSPVETPLVDWCNLQWPYTITIDQGQTTGNIYGQVWEPGVTDSPGQGAGIVAELGIGALGTDPRTDASWNWTATTFNTDVGNNDEYMANVTMTDPGDYSYCYRYSINGGPWTYGDIDGSNNGFDLAQMGTLQVNAFSGTQKLLISEIVVTPTAGEYVEIYNPNDATVNLDGYFITDATFASGGTYYYHIVDDSAHAGGGGFGDWHAKFPQGASIAPGEYQTIAMAGDSSFYAEYGVMPTYELWDDGHAVPSDAPDMLEAFPGSINGQGGLTNGDEFVVLYFWDGMSDLVKDVDYLIYDNAGIAPNESVDKTGVAIDGPDAGTDSTAYLDDTPIANQLPAVSHSFGFSTHRIDYSEGAQVDTAGNGITGADETSEDLNNTFTDYSVPSPNGPRITPTFTVDGTVTLENVADTLYGTVVTLEGPIKAVWTDTTDSNGYYAFAGLDSGTYALSFARDGYMPVDSSISVLDDVTIDITLMLIPPFTELVESFEGTFPPYAWSGDIGTSAPLWRQSSAYSNSGSYSVRAGYQATPPEGVSLVSPKIDMTQVANPVLDFWWREFYDSDGNSDSTFVEVSEDGMNWTTLGVLHADSSAVASWVPKSFDLSGYSSASMFWIRWRYVSDGGTDAWWVYLDDITLNAELINPPMLTANVYPGVEEVELNLGVSKAMLKSVMDRAVFENRTDKKEIEDMLSYNGRIDMSVLSKVLEYFSIYKSTDGVSFSMLDTTSTSTYVDSAVSFGNTVWYFATAMYTSGESEPSDTVSATPFDFTYVNTFPYEEGFEEDGAFPPAGWWTINYNALGGIYWWGLIDTSSGSPPGQYVHSGAYAASVMWNSTFDSDEWLVTPIFDFTGLSTPVLNFWFGYNNFWLGAHLEVLASSDGGANWDVLWVLDATNGTTPWGFTEVTLDLSAYSGEVMIAFRYVGLDGDLLTLDDILVDAVNSIEDQNGVPRTFDVAQNYPNPFNPTTTIKYQLPKQSDVRINVYDITGQIVRTLINRNAEAGYHQVVWDGANDAGHQVSSGVYFYKMVAGDFVKTQKMILMK